MRPLRSLTTGLLPVRLLPALLLPAMLLSAPLAAQQVYKWKDASGVTHFTSDPPPKGQQYETREVDHHQAATPATTGAATGADKGADAAKPRAASPQPSNGTLRDGRHGKRTRSTDGYAELAFRSLPSYPARHP